MSANGISHLPFKADRQRAKLELASQKRLAQGHPRPYVDYSTLTALYAPGDNTTIIYIEPIGGLVSGRPWTSTPPTPDEGFLILQTGDLLQTQEGGFIILASNE